jgi:hypothetical protein
MPDLPEKRDFRVFSFDLSLIVIQTGSAPRSPGFSLELNGPPGHKSSTGRFCAPLSVESLWGESTIGSYSHHKPEPRCPFHL